jgi:YegS/Rv2252/BmrU family lipid kinase
LIILSLNFFALALQILKMKKAYFIINPKSGNKNYLQVQEKIKRYVKKSHPESVVKIWKEKNQLGELVQEAKEGRYDIVFAVGGDGTVHCVGQYFIDTDIVLGIIPNGSGDGISRHFHIPKKVERALELIEKGHILRIDTGLINETPFIGFMGTGIDARVAHMFSSLTKRGFIPYAKLAISEYLKQKTEKYYITLENQKTFEIEPQVLSIANTSQFGNGAYISPGSSALDGILQLCKLDFVPHIKLPIAIYKIFNATCHELKEYQRWNFKQAWIERNGEDFGHVDGEEIHTGKKFFVKIKEKSLNLLVPKLGLNV